MCIYVTYIYCKDAMINIFTCKTQAGVTDYRTFMNKARASSNSNFILLNFSSRAWAKIEPRISYTSEARDELKLEPKNF